MSGRTTRAKLEISLTRYPNWWGASCIHNGRLYTALGDTKRGAREALRDKVESEGRP